MLKSKHFEEISSDHITVMAATNYTYWDNGTHFRTGICGVAHIFVRSSCVNKEKRESTLNPVQLSHLHTTGLLLPKSVKGEGVSDAVQ